MDQIEMKLTQISNDIELELITDIGTNDYHNLLNKPKINGVELLNQSFEELGLVALTNEELKNILK